MKKNTTKFSVILILGLSMLFSALPSAHASAPKNSNHNTTAIALGALGVLGAVGAGFAIFGNNGSSSDPAPVSAPVPAPAPAPNITSVSPAVGPLGGNTTVTINGTGFTGTTAVSFGNNNATSFTVDSATQITAVSPAGAAGIVDITVTTPNGASTAKFTYTAGPTISSLSKTAGPLAGGTPITITGTGFTGATAVTFGQTGIAFSVTDNEHISITSPNSGSQATVSAEVTVVTPYGTSDAATFTYQPAPILGGYNYTSNTLTVRGSNFSILGNNSITATINSTPVVVTFVSDTQLEVLITPDPSGHSIIVTNGDGQYVDGTISYL